MGYDSKDNRLRRKNAVGMEQLVQEFIREMKISSGLNNIRATDAWNQASGSSAYTLSVSLSKGILYVSLNSSMVRNHLYFQRDVIRERMNEILDKDELFIKPQDNSPAIKNIVLK